MYIEEIDSSKKHHNPKKYYVAICTSTHTEDKANGTSQAPKDNQFARWVKQLIFPWKCVLGEPQLDGGWHWGHVTMRPHWHIFSQDEII